MQLVAVPKIHPAWLSSASLSEFNAKRAGSGTIPLAIPTDYHQKLVALESWLCGVHIVYRYSLDFTDTGLAALMHAVGGCNILRRQWLRGRFQKGQPI